MTRWKPMAATMLAFAILWGGAARADDEDCQPADMEHYVPGGDECLAIKTYLPADVGSAKRVVIVLHGDLSRGGPADYIFPLAERAAELGQIGIAMMRVGYSGDGRRSTGTPSRQENRNDMYTADEFDAAAEAAKALKAQYGVPEAVMIGHSGGAATTGVIVGRHPGLLQRVLLIACPCDIDKWRQLRGRNPWPRAESPDDYIDDILPGTVVRLLVGSRDNNTYPDLSEDYEEDARARGLDVRLYKVDGAGHNLNESMVGSDVFNEALTEIIAGE